MKVVTAAQMREIDTLAASKYKISSLVLMENAGIRISDWIIRKFQPADKSVIFIIGSGNNGGDGLAAARHLLIAGVGKLVIFLLAADQEMSPGARKNLEILRALDIDSRRAARLPYLTSNTISLIRDTPAFVLNS